MRRIEARVTKQRLLRQRAVGLFQGGDLGARRPAPFRPAPGVVQRGLDGCQIGQDQLLADRDKVAGATWRVADVRDPALRARLSGVDTLVHLATERDPDAAPTEGMFETLIERRLRAWGLEMPGASTRSASGAGSR